MGFFDFLASANPAVAMSDAGQKVMGSIFTGVKDLIEEFHLSPEQAQQMKLKLAELELQSYQAQISDVQSARQMQMANKSAWPGVLTLVIVGGYFGLLGVMIVHGIPSTKDPGGEVLLTLIGVLATSVPMVLGYWFGTTFGKQNADHMLYNSVPATMAGPKPPTP